MLVVKRKSGERVLIGDDIWVTICEVSGNEVRLGVDAPPDVPIMREELTNEREPQLSRGDRRAADAGR